MSTPTPFIFDSQRFNLLYKRRFGVDSKPEYAELAAALNLSPSEGVELMEDITALVQQAFDAYFKELRSGVVN